MLRLHSPHRAQTLGPFQIRQVKESENDEALPNGTADGDSKQKTQVGTVALEGWKYDALMYKNPQAALSYMDDDDGDIVTVGSSLELAQRLDEPVGTSRRRRSRTALLPSTSRPADPHLSPVSAAMHMFDIERSPETISLWRTMSLAYAKSQSASAQSNNDSASESSNREKTVSFEQLLELEGPEMRQFVPEAKALADNAEPMITGLTREGQRQAAEAGERLRQSLQPNRSVSAQAESVIEAHNQRWASYSRDSRESPSPDAPLSFLDAFQEQMQKVNDVSALNDAAKHDNQAPSERPDDETAPSRQPDTFHQAPLNTGDVLAQSLKSVVEGVTTLAADLRDTLPEARELFMNSTQGASQRLETSFRDAFQTFSAHVQRVADTAQEASVLAREAAERTREADVQAAETIILGLGTVAQGFAQIGRDIFSPRTSVAISAHRGTTASPSGEGNVPVFAAELESPRVATLTTEIPAGETILGTSARAVEAEAAKDFVESETLPIGNRMDQSRMNRNQPLRDTRPWSMYSTNSARLRGRQNSRVRAFSPHRPHDPWRSLRSGVTSYQNGRHNRFRPRSTHNIATCDYEYITPSEAESTARTPSHRWPTSYDRRSPPARSRSPRGRHSQYVRSSSPSRSSSFGQMGPIHLPKDTTRFLRSSRLPLLTAPPKAHLDHTLAGGLDSQRSLGECPGSQPAVQDLQRASLRAMESDPLSSPLLRSRRSWHPYTDMSYLDRASTQHTFGQSISGTTFDQAPPHVPPKIKHAPSVDSLSNQNNTTKQYKKPSVADDDETDAKLEDGPFLKASKGSHNANVVSLSSDDESTDSEPLDAWAFERLNDSDEFLKSHQENQSRTGADDLYDSSCASSTELNVQTATEKPSPMAPLRRARTTGTLDRPPYNPYRPISNTLQSHHDDSLPNYDSAFPSASTRFPSLSQLEDGSQLLNDSFAAPWIGTSGPLSLPPLPSFAPLIPQNRSFDIPRNEHRLNSSEGAGFYARSASPVILDGETNEASRVPGAWPLPLMPDNVTSAAAKSADGSRSLWSLEPPAQSAANIVPMTDEHSNRRMGWESFLRSYETTPGSFPKEVDEVQSQHSNAATAASSRPNLLADDDINDQNRQLEQDKPTAPSSNDEHDVWQRRPIWTEPVAAQPQHGGPSRQPSTRSVRFSEQEPTVIVDAEGPADIVSPPLPTPIESQDDQLRHRQAQRTVRRGISAPALDVAAAAANRKRSAAIEKCAEQLGSMGFCEDAWGNKDMERLRIYAELANGEVDAALEVVEEERRAHGARY